MNVIRYIPFAGRLVIGFPFAMSGLGKLAAIGPTTEMIRTWSAPAAIDSRPYYSSGGWWRPFAGRGFPDSFGRHCARIFFAGRRSRIPCQSC